MLGNVFGRIGKVFKSSDEEKCFLFMAKIENTVTDTGSDLDKRPEFSNSQKSLNLNVSSSLLLLSYTPMAPLCSRAETLKM